MAAVHSPIPVTHVVSVPKTVEPTAPTPKPAPDPYANVKLDGMQRAVYRALVEKGLQPYQAAGVLGNMENESGFNVETKAMDVNGHYAYGLICWNAGSYPDADKLVTGDVWRDLGAQVDYLFNSTHNFWPAMNSGSTAYEIGGAFNHLVEVSVGSEPGGPQWTDRAQHASEYYELVK